MELRLHVGNLAFDTTAGTLRAAFSKHGAVSEVTVVSDRDTGRSRGFAFVTLVDEGSARNALERMDGATVDGRVLRVAEAEPRPAPVATGGRGGRS